MLQSNHLKEITIPKEILSEKREEAYFQFLKESCRSRQIETIYLTFPVKCADPLRWFNHHFSNYSSRFYWEIPSQASAIAALGKARRLSFESKDRFQVLENALHKADTEIATFNLAGNTNNLSPRWVGGFSFYPEISSSAWNGFQPVNFILPEQGIIKEKGETTGCISIEVEQETTPEELHHEISKRTLLFKSEYSNNGLQKTPQSVKDHSNIPEKNPEDEFQHWSGAIRDAKRMFHSGKMDKVVLTRKQQFSFDKPCNPVHSLFQLREQYPDGCSFLIENSPSPAFLGCSPELLLSADGHSIKTEALAGSIARGKTTIEDNELAEKLYSSTKDQQEHDYVVQSIRENLSPFLAEYNIPEEPTMKKLPNVQHLYTPVRGEMKPDITVLQMLEKLHPTPAVGGTPRSPALSFINRHEPFERGWFASPVGWITASGTAGFYVAIRSGLVDEEQALLYAGCGIVEDSDPTAEWDEANLKFKPMLSVLNNE